MVHSRLKENHNSYTAYSIIINGVRCSVLYNDESKFILIATRVIYLHDNIFINSCGGRSRGIHYFASNEEQTNK